MRTGKCGICNLVSGEYRNQFHDRLLLIYYHFHGHFPWLYWFCHGKQPCEFIGSTTEWFEPRIEFLNKVLEYLENELETDGNI